MSVGWFALWVFGASKRMFVVKPKNVGKQVSSESTKTICQGKQQLCCQISLRGWWADDKGMNINTQTRTLWTHFLYCLHCFFNPLMPPRWGPLTCLWPLIFNGWMYANKSLCNEQVFFVITFLYYKQIQLIFNFWFKTIHNWNIRFWKKEPENFELTIKTRASFLSYKSVCCAVVVTDITWKRVQPRFKWVRSEISSTRQPTCRSTVLTSCFGVGWRQRGWRR